ncbi:glycosyltransferase [Streptomyces sp. WMMC1477]|uniref:glycosyltransferase n=1 Tax=Streptomyces sp. WMMC1477 TaxID=3015155 RepID=UPI0022B7343D|nr:glycosyltransferase [Streptomyces sp. WMMC1477]MCZ7430448.1 glycosyltransferase [Streptomyces sp. WMMC1477]
MTVVHVAQPVEGGVARVVTDLVHTQTAAGLRVHVACPADGAPGAVPDTVSGTEPADALGETAGGPGCGTLGRAAAAAGAEVHAWPASRAPGPALPAETLRLARLLRRLRPDLVHAHSAKAGLAARLALRGGLPTLYQPHAWSFDAVEGAPARLARSWERTAARWATRVVCVSDAERYRGAAAGIPARWSVLPNGVDLERFRPATADEKRHARRTLPALDGVPTDAPLVVCVARLCAQKGQDLLLRAWTHVRARCPEAHLVLVGDGPDRAHLLRALSGGAPGQVLLAGAAADPVPWYRAADLVVLPSRWEGMALAPLEAMASGRPVVLTDVTGARESLPAALHHPCLVPPRDPPALARALTRLLADPRRRAAAADRALEHVRDHHDVRRTAAAVTDLYRAVLRGTGEPATGPGPEPVAGRTAERPTGRPAGRPSERPTERTVERVES